MKKYFLTLPVRCTPSILSYPIPHMSSSASPISSPVNDSIRETSPLLAGYRQTVVTSTASAIQHSSSNTAVAKYNGTWNRGQTIGGGRFSEVFLSQEAGSRQVRAVKEITSGRSDWVDREIQCMIVLKNVNHRFHPDCSDGLPVLTTSFPTSLSASNVGTNTWTRRSSRWITIPSVILLDK